MARPRSFDEAEVLDAIRDRFWSTGYAGTSLDDLMDATGLGKGSLYGAFGGKRDLFIRAFTNYCAGAVAEVQRALEGTDAGALKRLRAYVRARSSANGATENSRGCMLAKGTAESADQDAEVARAALRAFEGMRDAIARCIEQAQRHGDIAKRADARAHAGMLLAVMRGTESLGKAGMDASSLRTIADAALAGLPTP